WGPRLKTRGVDAFEPGQRRATSGQIPVINIQQAVAESLRHPGPAIVGGRAPDPDDEFHGPGRAGGLEELAEAVCRRLARVPPGVWDQRQPAGRGELQDRAPLPDQPVRGLDRLTERASYLRRALLSVVGRDDCSERPMS